MRVGKREMSGAALRGESEAHEFVDRIYAIARRAVSRSPTYTSSEIIWSPLWIAQTCPYFLAPKANAVMKFHSEDKTNSHSLRVMTFSKPADLKYAKKRDGR